MAVILILQWNGWSNHEVTVLVDEYTLFMSHISTQFRHMRLEVENDVNTAIVAALREHLKHVF